MFKKALKALCMYYVSSFDVSRRQVLLSPSLKIPFDQESSSNTSGHNSRTLYFYGPVTDESCFLLTRSLEEYGASDEPIHLHIQSSGGELMPTFNVVDTIERIQSPVYTYIEGYAASAATLISVAGKRRFMGKRSLMLLHQLSGKNQGTYSYMKEEMSNMDNMMSYVKDIYLTYSNLNYEMLKEILEYDNRWLNASTCLQIGLVDKIL